MSEQEKNTKIEEEESEQTLTLEELEEVAGGALRNVNKTPTKPISDDTIDRA